MADRLKDIIARISTHTGQDLLSAYEEGKKEIDGKKKPSKPEEKTEEEIKEIDEVREKLPNRISKKAYDRALKNLKPKNRAKEAKRNRANDIRRLHKLSTNLEKTHGKGVCPELIPSHLYKQTWQCIVDSTGAAIKLYLKVCPHSVAKTYIKRIALCPDEQGINKYSFAGHSRGSVRARCVAAFGLLLLGLSRPTRRYKGRWNRLVKGIPLVAFRKALTHPAIREQIPSINTFIGKHRSDPDNILTDGGVGYLRALKNGEFCYTMQAHWLMGEKPEHKAWQDITPNEIVPGRTESGWRVSLPRYWILTDKFMNAKDAQQRAELWIAWLAGQLPEEPESLPVKPLEPSFTGNTLSSPPPL